MPNGCNTPCKPTVKSNFLNFNSLHLKGCGGQICYFKNIFVLIETCLSFITFKKGAHAHPNVQTSPSLNTESVRYIQINKLTSPAKHVQQLFFTVCWWIRDDKQFDVTQYEHPNSDTRDRRPFKFQLRSLISIFIEVQTKCRIALKVGMHDIYRTDKLSTDMDENDVIFIAPINKWNTISRSDKVRLLVNQSINLIYLRFIRFPSASDCCFKLQWLSACVTLIMSSFVNMSSPVWKFFSVAEEDNAIAICNACSARIPRGGKRVSS